MSNIKYLLFSLLLVFNSTVFAQDKELVLDNEVYELETGGSLITVSTKTVYYVDLGRMGLIRFGGGYLRYINNDLEVVWERKVSDFKIGGKVMASGNGSHIYLTSIRSEVKGLEPYNEYLQTIQVDLSGNVTRTSDSIFLGKNVNVYRIYSSASGLHYLYAKGKLNSETRNIHFQATFAVNDLSHHVDTLILPSTGVKVGDQVFRGNTVWSAASYLWHTLV